MANPSKQKGNTFERNVVKIAQNKGLPAIRAWGSNGQSLGLHESVDVLLNNNIKIQCKCRKKIAKWIKPDNEVDIQVIKEDYGDIYVIIPYNDFLNYLNKQKDHSPNQ